jgi:hypothetical protein
MVLLPLIFLIMRTIFFTIYLFLPTFLAAQVPDTLLSIFSPDDITTTWINEMTPVSHNKVVCNKAVPNSFEAIVTNNKGELLYRRAAGEVDGFTLKFNSYVFDDNDRYVFMCNAEKDGKSYFLTVAFDTTLQNGFVIDTLQLQDNVGMNFNVVRFNEYKDIWEGFGVLRNDANQSILQNTYIALNNTYYFQQYEYINFGSKVYVNGNYQRQHIIDFFWYEPTQSYILASANTYTMIVDINFNVVYSNRLLYTLVENNITNNYNLQIQSSQVKDNGEVVCYIGAFFGLSSLITLDIQADTVSVDQVYPLNGPNEPLLGIGILTQMRVDNDGNYIISGNDAPSSGATNTMIIAKYSTDFKRIWAIKYKSEGKGYNIWDMDIDEHNDIYVAGMCFNHFGSGTVNGYLFKVFSDGQLTSDTYSPYSSSEEWHIIPNPVYDKICLQTDVAHVESIKVTGLDGRVLVYQLLSQPCLYLDHELPAGMYISEWVLDGGKHIVAPIIIGR